MIQALVHIARWVGLAHDRWRERVAGRRPLAADIDSLRVRIEKLRAENELLRARLLRLDSRRRPHFAPWERLDILWHQARYGLSIEATARVFVVSIQMIVNGAAKSAAAPRALCSCGRPSTGFRISWGSWRGG